MKIRRKSIDLPENIAKFLRVEAVENDISYKALLESIVRNEFIKLKNMSDKTKIKRIEQLKNNEA